MSDFTKRVITEEDNKRFSEWLNNYWSQLKTSVEVKDDFDHTDEAKERVEADLDQTINYYYENMMIGD